MHRLKLALMGLGMIGMVSTAWSQTLPKAFQQTGAKVTLLEFSAPWCLSCQKLQPEVKALEKQLGTKLHVQYLNIEKPETQRYIDLYKIESAPTFILYNAQGKLTQRIDHDITPMELRKLINKAIK